MLNETISQSVPMGLTLNERITPGTVMQDFFWEYSLPECKKFLWDWLVTALQDKDTNAGATILFYESLMRFIEAAYQKTE